MYNNYLTKTKNKTGQNFYYKIKKQVKISKYLYLSMICKLKNT